MLHSTRTNALVALVVLALALSGVVAIDTSPGVSATPRTSASILYLDIGASVSVGVQPTPAVPKGQPTDHGYANQLVALEAAKGVNLKLAELGCPGESLSTMLLGGDRCYQAPDTQMSDAVAFLRLHHNEDTLVTIDLGFNTVDPCFRGYDVDLVCVAPLLVLLRQQLSQVLSVVKAAAGPNVTMIGVGHYNPFLGSAIVEGKAEFFATDSVRAIGLLNNALRETYAAHGMTMASVSKAFHEETTHIIYSAHNEAYPVNVLYECGFTWMCQPAPYGPNIHPNDAGYEAISDAIAAVLPKTL